MSAVGASSLKQGVFQIRDFLLLAANATQVRVYHKVSSAFCALASPLLVPSLAPRQNILYNRYKVRVWISTHVILR